MTPEKSLTPGKITFSEGGVGEAILVIFHVHNNRSSVCTVSSFCHFPPKLSFSEGKGWSFKIVAASALISSGEHKVAKLTTVLYFPPRPRTLSFFFLKNLSYSRGGGGANLKKKIIFDFTAFSKLTETVQYSAFQGTISDKPHSNRLLTLFRLINRPTPCIDPTCTSKIKLLVIKSGNKFPRK